MRRLSAPSTYVYKRAFPIFWLGALAILIVLVSAVFLDPDAWTSHEQWASFGFPFVVIGIGSVFTFKILIADLTDEVWLDNDQLLVKNRGEQGSIALTDVINVNATSMTNPRRITLMLRVASRFGRNITFIPDSPRGFAAAFKPDPIATELIGRIDALRQARR
jgi:hypothetical protein